MHPSAWGSDTSHEQPATVDANESGEGHGTGTSR